MHLGPPEIDARAQGYNFGLYSVFEDRAALDKYAISDAHVNCVKENVRPYISGEKWLGASADRRRHGVRLGDQ